MSVRSVGKCWSKMMVNPGQKCQKINVGQNDDKMLVRNVGKYWKTSVKMMIKRRSEMLENIGRCQSEVWVNVGQK